MVLRLAGERSLTELAGVPDDEQADALEEAIEERRARRTEDRERVASDIDW